MTSLVPLFMVVFSWGFFSPMLLPWLSWSYPEPRSVDTNLLPLHQNYISVGLPSHQIVLVAESWVCELSFICVRLFCKPSPLCYFLLLPYTHKDLMNILAKVTISLHCHIWQYFQNRLYYNNWPCISYSFYTMKVTLWYISKYLSDHYKVDVLPPCI